MFRGGGAKLIWNKTRDTLITQEHLCLILFR